MINIIRKYHNQEISQSQLQIKPKRKWKIQVIFELIIKLFEMNN
jgi:hypothetical protein